MKYYALKTKPSDQIVRTEFIGKNLGATAVFSLCYAPDGTVFAGTDKGLHCFDGEKFVKIPGVTGEVSAVFTCSGDKIFAAAGKSVYTVADGKVTNKTAISEPAIGFVLIFRGTYGLQQSPGFISMLRVSSFFSAELILPIQKPLPLAVTQMYMSVILRHL